MARLLDRIFQSVVEKNLNKSQLEAYFLYLDELIAGGLSVNKELAYQNLKLQLLKKRYDLH